MVEFLNHMGRLWYEPFGLLVVQNTVFLVLVFAALYWLRGASARVRYAVAMAGVVKLILPPFVATGTSSAPAYMELPGIASVPYHPLTLPGAADAHAAVAPTMAGVLFALWCIIALGVVVHTVTTTLLLHRSLRDAEEAHDDDSLEWTRRTGIRVCVSGRVPVPMTVGMFPATIFVPPEWHAWTSAGRLAVLRHEVAHIHRHDGLVRSLETVTRALYWFHPLVALLVQRIDVYREQACDERAAAPDPEGRLAYSQQLVEIAEHLLRRPGVRGSASALLRRRNELLGRVRYLTREGTTMKMNKARAAVIIVAMVVAITSLSWYHSTATPPKSKAKAGGYANVDLSMAKGGKVTVDGRKVTLEQVGDAIKKQIDDKDAVIHIKCDRKVPMSELFAVHQVLRKAGMLKVSYQGLDLESGEMPLVLPSQKLIEKTKQLAPEDVARLEVGCCGKCVFAGKKMKSAALVEHVQQSLQENQYLVISLTMDKDSTFGDYMDALKSLKLAKAQRIFINEPSTF
jgi:beta-lactamase regulating signal transducer with metallopeptidase domain